MNLPDLVGYCWKCDTDIDFRYLSTNVAVAGNPERHYYVCTNNCGVTYELQKLITLENIRRIHDDVTPEKR